MESLDIFIEYWDSIIVYHVILGILFAGIAILVNQLIPYSFAEKPKDVKIRKFVFFGVLILVAIASFLADTYWILVNIANASPDVANDAQIADLIEELKTTRPISMIITLLTTAGLYYGAAYYMKNSLRLFKCFSVFKFK